MADLTAYGTYRIVSMCFATVEVQCFVFHCAGTY